MNKTLYYLFNTLFFAIISLIIFTACQSEKENCEPVSEELDPVYDLAGYLDPYQGDEGAGSLFYMPGYLDVIISRFGAENLDGNIYGMQIELEDGTMDDFVFTAFEVDLPYLYVTETQPGELKSRYKVYKDAECKEVEKVFANCFKMADGRYHTLEYQKDYKKCKKGKGICIEIEQVAVIKKYYEDSECSILDEAIPMKLFICD